MWSLCVSVAGCLQEGWLPDITSYWSFVAATHRYSCNTTGLVGLAVAQNPHDRLRILYTKILTALQTIPKDAAYRKYTEEIVNNRFNAIKTESDLEKLEKKINCGQIEEVIVQAENELYLARKMAEWKPWEPLIEEPPANQWKWPI
ncbi:NADH dehydrogenase [ubiquinone] 1 alpha subcomplex subunit 5 isoform X1 [Rhinoderma darwinii]|uniref:NADH dehydrogenase [ubiquinone] 1 alpha subcomplex subunit 5 isoform X1 n=1 Tax=Rhinoderma darwinii TaxID=43563 RepID=UPI003F670A36